MMLKRRQQRIGTTPAEKRFRGRRIGSDPILDVVGFVWNHVPHTAARVGHITVPARYDMHMQVKHSLTARCPHIDADVIAIRLAVTKFYLLPGYSHPSHNCLLLNRLGCEPVSHMLHRHQQCMTGGHRKTIPETHNLIVAVENAARIGLAKRAGTGR